MTDKVGASGYMNSPEYAKLKKEHPKADIKYDESTQSLKWTEKSGVFGSSAAGGTVYLDEEVHVSVQMDRIFEQMDSMKLDEYISQGFLTPKKNFLDGEYYEFDIAKYKELTGKDITLGEIKKMLGLPDGALKTLNNIGFKSSGHDRDLDTAPISEVLRGQTVKVLKSSVFAKDGR